MQLTVNREIKTFCALCTRYYLLLSNLAYQSHDDATIIHANNESLSVIEYANLVQKLLLNEVAILLNNLKVIRSQRLKLYLFQLFKTVFYGSLYEVSFMKAKKTTDVV